jgi:hypothetical protein
MNLTRSSSFPLSFERKTMTQTTLDLPRDLIERAQYEVDRSYQDLDEDLDEMLGTDRKKKRPRREEGDE